ncbi:uncharacterized protein LOC135833174 [Planococcus citri]|uniref:uncharacterized protein LOC135833174 n=1 Tax=Planococcus citri TaxID=170843 RepID=UPI0031F7D9A2
MNVSQYGVFFLLLSFWYCTFLSTQAPIPDSDEDIPNANDIPGFVNYKKKALKLLGIVPAPGSTVDWQEAFMLLAPIAINNARIIDYASNMAKNYAKEAKRNSGDAGRYQFILISRNKIVFIEDHYCKGAPENDDEFRQKIKEDERFKNIPDNDISCKKHAKKWLWMLVKGNAKIFTQLNDLRKRLNDNADQFIWFAEQIQGIFDVFNDNVHSASSLLDPKHLDLNNIGKHMGALSPDVQKAMKILYETEGFNVNIVEDEKADSKPADSEAKV